MPKLIAEVRDLGLEVFVTELDVDDSHLTVEGDARDEAIADVYKRYLDLLLGTASVSVMITWGRGTPPKRREQRLSRDRKLNVLCSLLLADSPRSMLLRWRGVFNMRRCDAD